MNINLERTSLKELLITYVSIKQGLKETFKVVESEVVLEGGGNVKVDFDKICRGTWEDRNEVKNAQTEIHKKYLANVKSLKLYCMYLCMDKGCRIEL